MMDAGNVVNNILRETREKRSLTQNKQGKNKHITFNVSLFVFFKEDGQMKEILLLTATNGF